MKNTKGIYRYTFQDPGSESPISGFSFFLFTSFFLLLQFKSRMFLPYSINQSVGRSVIRSFNHDLIEKNRSLKQAFVWMNFHFLFLLFVLFFLFLCLRSPFRNFSHSTCIFFLLPSVRIPYYYSSSLLMFFFSYFFPHILILFFISFILNIVPYVSSSSLLIIRYFFHFMSVSSISSVYIEILGAGVAQSV
jgi:hypothetical protein